MRALSERDAAAVLAVTAELGALDEPDPFPPRLIGRLSRLLGCFEGFYCELDRGARTRVCQTSWSDGAEASVGLLTDPDALYWRLRHSHPVCAYRERSSDWTTARMVVDFMSLAGFRRIEIWDELYRDEHMTDSLGRSSGWLIVRCWQRQQFAGPQAAGARVVWRYFGYGEAEPSRASGFGRSVVLGRSVRERGQGLPQPHRAVSGRLRRATGWCVPRW